MEAEVVATGIIKFCFNTIFFPFEGEPYWPDSLKSSSNFTVSFNNILVELNALTHQAEDLAEQEDIYVVPKVRL